MTIITVVRVISFGSSPVITRYDVFLFLSRVGSQFIRVQKPSQHCVHDNRRMHLTNLGEFVWYTSSRLYRYFRAFSWNKLPIIKQASPPQTRPGYNSVPAVCSPRLLLDLISVWTGTCRAPRGRTCMQSICSLLLGSMSGLINSCWPGYWAWHWDHFSMNLGRTRMFLALFTSFIAS